MKKTVTIVVAALALAGMLLATATTAVATPGQTTPCANCHGRSTAVKVAVTRVSGTSKTVTYRVKVTGGSGATGWAVQSGGKNLARSLSSTGTFKVAKGKAIKVWGVKKSTGANYKALTAK
jgi:hypothetical protein